MDRQRNLWVGKRDRLVERVAAFESDHRSADYPAEAAAAVLRAAAPLLLHDDGRADLDPVVEIDHVLIGQANAAR